MCWNKLEFFLVLKFLSLFSDSDLGCLVMFFVTNWNFVVLLLSLVVVVDLCLSLEGARLMWRYFSGLMIW